MAGTARAIQTLALRRDAEAWALLLRLHGQEILRTTKRILNDDALAEDACQETLLQIRDRAAQFRGGSLPAEQADTAARNWIMRIACNTALHILRTRKRAKHREEALAYRANPIEVATAAELSERDALARLVRGELAEMPEKQRRPLVLHFFGGLTYEQLAQELSCNAGAARVRVHRALEKLRQRMSALGVVFSATALYALLESSTAQAAEFVAGPERLAQWQNLLTSSSSAAINVVSDPQFPLVAQAGYAAAIATLCGSLAFTGWQSSGSPKDGTLPGTQAMAHGSHGKNGSNGTTDEAVRLAGETPAVEPVRTTRFPELPVSQPVRVPRTPAAQRKPETPQTGMVSPLAQLKLLQTMQHELNQHVQTVHGKLLRKEGTAQDQAELQERLKELGEDQEEIARLMRVIAEQIDGK